jgi:hypothetical protein
MLSPLGWGEAALDVRFMSAHQGRRLDVIDPKQNVTAPAWVGKILIDLLISLNF